MSLGSICIATLSEIGGFEVPSSYYGNGNLTAVMCVSLAQREGATLERTRRFSELLGSHTFTTVADQESYALPDGFRAFAEGSIWDRTNNRRLVGPASGEEWQWLKSSIGAGATIDRWFRVAGNELQIHPTPTASGDTIAFDFYSRLWISKQAGGYSATWTNDNDTGRIDEDLLAMGLKWRFLQAKGMPFEPEYKEYESVLESIVADNAGKRSIVFGRQRRWDGLPDTGYGA